MISLISEYFPASQLVQTVDPARSEKKAGGWKVDLNTSTRYDIHMCVRMCICMYTECACKKRVDCLSALILDKLLTASH